MAENKIQIEVDVVGVAQAEKQLDKIEQSTAGIGEGIKGVGESFKGVGDVISAQGGVMGEAFGALGESVGGLVDGFDQLKGSMESGGKIGITSILGMLGPLAALASGLALAIEAYRQFSGAAKEAEQIEAAVSAAAGDLTAKMEELAEKGIKATHEQLRTLIELNTDSRLGLEILNEKNANLTKVYRDQIEAERNLIWVKNEYKNLTEEELKSLSDLTAANFRMKEANEAVAKAQEALTSEYEKSLPAVEKAQEYQRNLATTQEEALDALKGQLEIQKEYNDLLLETAGLTDYQKSLQQKQKELEIDSRLDGQRKESVQSIIELTKVIEDENKARQEGDLLSLKEIKNQQELEKIKADEKKRLQDEAKARSEAFKARQQQVIGEQSQINALMIQLQKDGSEEQLALAVNTYETQVKLNKNNRNQLVIAALQYQQQIKAISDQEIALQEQQLQAQRQIDQQKLDQENAFFDELFTLGSQRYFEIKDAQHKIELLDIQLTMNGYDQQIAMLEAQQKKELELVEEGSLQAIEIKKRYQLASKDLQTESMQMLGEFAEAQTQAFSASLATALMTGASIKQVVKDTLTGLATEALSKSIFHTAEGFASLALGPIGGLSASQHFTAAGLFAGVAATAGLAGASISSSKGGGGGGSASSSPTGLTQSSSVQRPEASKAEPMVFNLNFQGSTIYDTKESAKRAMSDELVKYINEPRRGSPRLRVN
jgi:sulfur relay (sulfurtransferase) DsrF/TusC family protein